ncbi:hypothetical protein SEPL_338 [Salmonella phage SE_PL]|uniref:hypothetical protein n=1 Tax=Salmonella enterica TaxID=28901 RepID=UPI000FDF96D0|nr:hypothetical protein CPT_Munch_085 [Salmonella phage Munch]EAZ2022882.1 hypothetical protein [Salmonella enterica]ECV9084016.1 hypothetical protein [Salmonella enterica subsp. enterica serovar Infantis]MCP0435883.1 hypothetical protein [Salmonella enterica subsp. enterica serovar Mbandaka]QCW18760.1 hypothetical protein 7t3_0239 [Salmonella phage 7t3]QIG62951.1 hypothetical protein SEPL_338 [Salmonella phage SE_PL]WNV47191.1 hypothetical protein [Klebsiella phage fENko-Kae01]
MKTNHSENLKTIGGVVLINHEGSEKLCCLEDMQHTKFFTIGQLFNAIRVYHGKDVSDYGDLWPSYRNRKTGEVSSDWETLKAVLENCESDYDFMVEACAQLNEEVPEVLERKTVLERLELFRNGQLN